MNNNEGGTTTDHCISKDQMAVSKLNNLYFNVNLSFSCTNFKQNRQCSYNVIFRRYRLTIVVVEKQYVLHILSVSVGLIILHQIITSLIIFIQATIFRKRFFEHEIRFYFLYKSCLKYLFL